MGAGHGFGKGSGAGEYRCEWGRNVVMGMGVWECEGERGRTVSVRLGAGWDCRNGSREGVWE